MTSTTTHLRDHQSESTTGAINLAVEIGDIGAHPATWESELAPAATDPQRIATYALAAEIAGFAIATFAESSPYDRDIPVLTRIDPISAASYTAALTSRLAVVPVVGVIHAEPFHLANQLASLDFAARGRSGWIVDAEDSIERARRYDAQFVIDREQRRAEADDVVAAVRQLWDTWEDGVFIADTETGHFLDPDRLHFADFEGKFFSVKGPSITPRPPQGHLPVIAHDGRLAASQRDVAIINATTSTSIAHRAARHVEGPTLTEVEVLLDETDQQAQRRSVQLDRIRPWRDAERLRYIGSADGLVTALRDLSSDVDTVRLIPSDLEHDLRFLTANVLPALRELDLLRAAGSTLRETLGLAAAGNVFSVARSADAAQLAQDGAA